jgi:hypothetical protein
MPTMDATALRREADGLPALRTALGLDELAPCPNEKRPDMYRPRKCLVEASASPNRPTISDPRSP